MGEIADAAAGRLLGEPPPAGAIDLSVGEPDFDTPSGIREAASRAIAAGDTRYTPRLGLPELREAVRVRLASDKGYEPAYEDTVVTAGGSPAACIAIAASCAAGDSIVLPDPSWPNYEMFAARIGVASRRYRQDPGQELDLDEIDALIDGSTRLIVLNSPANPTGHVVTRSETEAIVELAARRNIWILSDEAYESIVFDGGRSWSPCAVEGLGRTFACYTFSKTYAMTGWRVGYLVAPPEFRRAVLELQATMTGCAPTIAQRGAVYAVAHCSASAESMRLAYQRRKDLAVQELEAAALLDGVPRGAFYLWLNVARTGMTGLEVTDWLRSEAGVVVSAGEVYSQRSPHHVRASFAVGDDQLRGALGRIRSGVEKLVSDGARGAA
jgi:aspartate/methionine/tyrosine aminotransferase